MQTFSDYSFSGAPGSGKVGDEGIFISEALSHILLDANEFGLEDNGVVIKLLEVVGGLCIAIMGKLGPLVAISGELNTIAVPGTLEVLWSTLW